MCVPVAFAASEQKAECCQQKDRTHMVVVCCFLFDSKQLQLDSTHVAQGSVSSKAVFHTALLKKGELRTFIHTVYVWVELFGALGAMIRVSDRPSLFL